MPKRAARPAFSKLAAAVKFLADAIAKNDYGALAHAVHEPLPAPWVLVRLWEKHNTTPLPHLYAGWEFPVAAKSFKLGGHGKELGHIHIDFLKSRAGWEFERIWMCR